ncbi:acyltransferase [Metallibacterium sp.]|uniref:LpxL/LpxP family acyltransferase n=1 Tax=Metallibacterium sp. TaxID=2940281 RepID=UPI00261A21E4|nr:acyltransferase [Metallibacterium sp.]
MSGWQGRREGGGWFALWLIRFIGLRLGRAPARLLLYPVTLYFFMRRGSERRASRAYLTRMFGRPARTREVLRHFHAFAATTLDRVFLLARGARGFHFEISGLDVLEQALAGGRGALLIGAHVGSFEALRVLVTRRPDLDLRLVLDRQQTPALNMLLEALAPTLRAQVIDAAQGGVTVMLALGEAARHGALLALLGDRARHGEATCRVPLLGAAAPLPAAPWRVAAALQVPVLLSFGLYASRSRYHLRFEAFAESIELPRAADARAVAIQACAARYAARIEAQLRESPYNWFNFYDFWQTPELVPAAGDAAGVGG